MDLDAPLRSYDKFDGHRTYGLLLDWPRLASLGLGLKPQVSVEAPDEVVLLGLGSSASVGDIVSDWLLRESDVSSRVFRWTLPRFSLKKTLVIACSVSGNTPETVEMTRSARKRGADVVAIASGGALESLSSDLGIPFIKLPIRLTGRFGFPCLLYAVFNLVGETFPRLGVGEELRDSIETLENVRETIRPQSPMNVNDSKRVAAAIGGNVPVVYGSSATRGVAVRFKNQLNENAKLHAMAEFAPDSFHHEVESWLKGSSGFVPILLRHGAELGRERRLLDFYEKDLKKRGFGPVEVRGSGEGHIGQLASLAFKLDFASYFAAVSLDRDPYPIELIEEMKSMKV